MPRPRIIPRSSQGNIKDPWETLSSGIRDTLSHSQSRLQLSTLHRACGMLVSKGELDKLIKGMNDMVDAHFAGWHKELLNVTGNILVEKFSNIYEDFKNLSSILPKFYMLLDRQFPEQKNKTLNQIRSLFLKRILADKDLIYKSLEPGLIQAINSARSGNDFTIHFSKMLVEMLYSFTNNLKDKLDLFPHFFGKMNEETFLYYESFYQNKFNASAFPQYIQTVADQFQIEKRLIDDIFNPDDSKELLMNALQSLLVSNEDEFLSGETPPISDALIASNQFPLKWLVDTYRQYGIHIERLYTTCAQFVKNEMLKLQEYFPELQTDDSAHHSPNDPIKNRDIPVYIYKLMQCALRLSTSYRNVFNPKEIKESNQPLINAITDAWNEPRFNIIENFCIYIDSIIKSEFNNVSFEDPPETIHLFYKYLTEKRSFDIIYDTYFMRRLIKMRNKLPDLEFPIISAIRKTSPDFLINYDKRIKCVNDSLELSEEFRSEKQSHDVDISPVIFNQRYFPLSDDKETLLPNIIEPVNSEFIQFYQSKHQQRKLELLCSCTTVEFKFQRAPRVYTLTTDVPCAIILSYIADKKTATYKDLCEELKIDKQYINKGLQKLTNSSSRILIRSSQDKQLQDTDVFQLNNEFQSKTTKITISPVRSDLKKDKIIAYSRIDDMKAVSIKANICRVLKQRNSLELSDLERYVINTLQSYFKVEVSNIRKALKDLESTDAVSRMIKQEQNENGQVIVTYVA